LATIQVLEGEASPAHVAEVDAHLRRGLESLQEKYPRIAPALIGTKDDVDQALEVLDHAFAEVQERV
jgi:4-aminobutyrate aminotransferase-like enzyme